MEREELDVLQADIDDESPQVLAAACERALLLGALDAHLCPLLMKKGRPGTRIEVLCRPEHRELLVRLLLSETSTLGVKVRRVERYSLARRFAEVDIRGQRIRIKIAELDGAPLRAVPEYEDCRAAAAQLGLPVRQVIEEAKAAASEVAGEAIPPQN